MSEIKVSLTIALPGGTMLNRKECFKTINKIVERKAKFGRTYKKTIKVQVEDLDKMDKNTLQVTDSDNSNSEVITFYTRKSKPATQSININRKAYDYMVSKECPSWSKVGVWSQMKSKQRLESHLQKIAEYLGGNIVSFKIFDD